MTHNPLVEQTDDCLQHGPDGPSRIPLLSVVLSDRQAYLGIYLKAAVFVVEDDVWRLEGILKRKQYLTMV